MEPKTLNEIGCIDVDTGEIIGFVSKKELREVANEWIQYFQKHNEHENYLWVNHFFNLQEELNVSVIK